MLFEFPEQLTMGAFLIKFILYKLSNFETDLFKTNFSILLFHSEIYYPFNNANELHLKKNRSQTTKTQN